MGTKLHVLTIENSEEDTGLLVSELRRGGYDVEFERTTAPEALRKTLPRQKWDIIVSNSRLALVALQVLKESELDIPLLIVSGSAEQSTLREAMKQGAQDYFIKGDLMRLIPVVERELRQTESRRARKRLEEQFRHSQKMEAIGRLAGGVAHDFNNLLTVISGYTELLLNREGLQEVDDGALEEIRKAANRGGALTHQLLAFSRRQALEPKILDLNQLVINMEKMLRRLIGEDIHLATALGANPARVKTDPGQLEQVIMNVAINARDAMPTGGKLTIETANVALNEHQTGTCPHLNPGPYVLLAIGDNGCGMDAETLAHLFEPFFTTKEPGKGTGLGLATVYGIISQSGGGVSVMSGSGKGTTVSIYLPWVEDAIPEALPQLDGRLLHGSETVLLVEDEARVRKLIAEILSAKGYSVLECTQGEEALQVSEAHPGPVHVVITDVVMPGMSGPELVKKLLVRHPQLRVLFISGYTDEAMATHGVLDSGVAFLQKPFVPDALARKVREVLKDLGADGLESAALA